MKRNERATVNKRPVFFYPGRDNEYNLKAIPAENTLITGYAGTGKTQIINQIIIQLMQQYSPSEVQIYIIDGHGFEQVDWRVKKKGEIDPDRILPHVVYTGQTVDSYKDNYITDIGGYIECITQAQLNKIAKGFTINETNVIIIDDVQLTEELKHDLKRVANLSKNVVIVYAVQPSDLIDEEFVGLFKNRICLKSSARVSELILHCNVASDEFLTEKGVCYYNNVRSDYFYKKLWIKYTPISVINKLIGAFSIRLKDDTFLEVCKKNAERAGNILYDILKDVDVRVKSFEELNCATSALKEIGIVVKGAKLEPDDIFLCVYLQINPDWSVSVITNTPFIQYTEFSKIRVI